LIREQESTKALLRGTSKSKIERDMPSAWSESPPEMVAAENGSGAASGGRPARTSSYVPPHLRNRPQGAAHADGGAEVAVAEPKAAGGAGVLGASGGAPGARPAWGNPNAVPFQAAGAAAALNTVNGSGWGSTPAVNHSASWGNGGGRGYGGGGRGSRGGWEREANPFANDEPVSETIFEQENTGINFDAYEDIPVETSGQDVPPPVNTFAEIDLGPALNENIRRCKYVKPTPVQKHAIPISLGGRDLMACAQTGSGKTAAFCFPIIAGIMRNTPPGRPRGGRKALPLALILSPTRELSCQVNL
jgi:ATP-dependent RNA helicase DDX3X